MTALPTSYKAIICPGVNQPWKEVTLPMREVAPTEVLIKVHASGICGSDHFVQDGTWPGITYPRVPGHEIVGRVVAIGSGIGLNSRFKVGDLAGVGWNGGYCGACDPCRVGDFSVCVLGPTTGFTHDGGHGEYIYAPERSVVSLPEEALEHASYAELAPLLCAGVTVFDAIRTTPFIPGDICLVQGIGGLGHLAVQYAAKMGLKVYAVSSGPSKAALAKSLGAYEYIDSKTIEVVPYILSLGGAKVIICTAPSSDRISALIPAVARNGVVTLVSAAVDGDVRVSNLLMNMKRVTLRGWSCGVGRDAENCVKFSILANIKPMVREYKLEEFIDAYEDMIQGGPKFRNVIVFH
ncbi:hypothetical protein EW146_g160 [Bondarzewia mesenterica]|uniref:Enoyl reductase (ER) domain-containing protein n=1 Tax=Bondarzewia mesenterica TaxID=1095465 RepID=A0A4V3XGH0_9AGAM|nr:hypothetical protein EW146_g160 [Bondarzewia mesenterica]